MGRFGPASCQRLPVTMFILFWDKQWEAGFPIICSKFPFLKLFLPPQSPHIMETLPFNSTTGVLLIGNCEFEMGRVLFPLLSMPMVVFQLIIGLVFLVFSS